MRWLVVRRRAPLSYSSSETAHAQPPGPGFPMHAPSVKTTVAGRVSNSGHRASLPARASAGRGRKASCQGARTIET